MAVKKKKKTKRRSPIDLRLEAIEIRLGRMEQQLHPVAHSTRLFVAEAVKLASDYKAIGDVKQLIGDLDLTMFAVFHSTRDLLTYMQRGGDVSEEPPLVVDRPFDPKAKPLRGR